MKKVVYRFLVSVIVVIISVSCEKVVNNIKFPEFTQKLVISGCISPDNAVNYIKISSNLRNYGDLWALDTVGKVTVTLTDGINMISLDTTKSGYFFNSSDFPVIAGKTYTLNVNTETGLSAEASSTIPFRYNFDLEIDTIRTIYHILNYGEDVSIHTEIYFTDPEGEENYYTLLCEQISYISKWSKTPYIFPITIPGRSYLNDKGRDGTRFKIALSGIGASKDVDSSFLKVYLLNTDKVYYDYQKSLENYNSGEDPFTEPSPIYSNITGGLGIFAAYTIDSMILRLK
jgi:hypothetical protein